MACKINNQQLKELFFNGLSYDFETYKVYRNTINRFLAMDGLDDESKVYSIWFMGLLYNQALEMDPNIVTEDLPLAISKVVKEKLFEENTNFTPLLQQVKDILTPQPEAELEAPAAAEPVTEAAPESKLVFQIGDITVHELDGSFDVIDPEEGIIGEYITDKQRAIDIATAAHNKRVASKPAPAPAPKARTLAQNLNDMLAKVSKAKDFSTAYDMLNEYVKLISYQASMDASAKVNALKKFAEAVGRMPDITGKSALVVHVNNAIQSMERPVKTGTFLNLGDVVGVGKDAYIITREDGTPIEAYFNTADGRYYQWNERFDGTNFEVLEPIDILESDYIQPIYRVKENLSKTDESGDFTRFQLDFMRNAVFPQGVVRNPNIDNRTGLQRIADSLPTGVSLVSQVRMTADKRPGEVFRKRMERIKSLYPQMSRELNLRPAQRAALQRNPNQPVVGFIYPIGGLQLRISDLTGQNYDILETFDQLRFIYADGRVEPIDLSNETQANKFRALVQVKKGEKYVAPDGADLANLSYAIERLKDLKARISDMMEDSDVMEIPQDLMQEYLTVSNNLTDWDFVNAQEYANPKQTLEEFTPQLTSIGSTIDAKIAPKEFGKVGLSRDHTLVGVIKRTPKGFTFEDVLPAGHVLLSPTGQVTTIEELFAANGMNREYIQTTLNSFKKGHKYFYLFKLDNGSWFPRPMAKAAPISSKEEMVGFVSALSAVKEYVPEYTKENAEVRRTLIQQFNNQGWGFNAYQDLIANIKFLRTYGTEDAYGIELRAEPGYQYADKFNAQKIELQFSFEPYDVRKQLDVIYKALKKNPANYNSVEKRLQLAKEVQDELRANADTLKPAVKKAIEEIASIFNKAQSQLFAQANQVIKAHAQDVAKGEDQYLDADNSFMQLLFSDPKTGAGFRLRSATVSQNPLTIYKVFDSQPGQAKDKVLRVRLSDTPTIADASRATAPKPVKSVAQPAPPATAPAPTTSITRRRRIESLVASLEGLKTLSSSAFAAEVAEAQRLLGKVAQIQLGDLSATDVDGVALGIMEDQLIKLDSNIRAKGVAFHEAFHAIFRLSLNSQQRQAYYSAVKKITGGIQEDTSGKYINSKGQKVYLDDFRAKRRFYGLPDASIENLIYEEYMADGFADYKADNKEPKNAIIRFFYNLLDKLISLFKSKQYKAARDVRRLYQDINTGKYADVLSSDPFEGPIAYELAEVPKYINENGDVIAVAVDALTYDQVKDMVVAKLAKKGATAENFDEVYDTVTEDLIAYYNVEVLINDTNRDRADQIRAAYGSLFNDFRYLMGYAHRYQGQFKLENRSGQTQYDDIAFNDNVESLATATAFKEQVRKDYENISVIKDPNISDEEQAAEIENGTVDDEDPEFVQSNAEEEVGERYDDDGIITLKPYEGTREFQRILRYIEYDYVDKALGVTFKKMVNSRFVMSTIRKVVANTTIEDIMPKLAEHIELLDSNIDAFYRTNLYSELGKIPQDMVKLIEEANTLRAVYYQFNDNAGTDENGMPTIANGAPMLAMFHKVFELAQVEIINQSINQTVVFQEQGEPPVYENTISNERIVEKKSVNDNTNAFKQKLDAAYMNLSDERIEYIDNIIKSEFPRYQVPDSVESFNYTVDMLYRLTSLMELNIPRNLIEFSVASHTYRINKRNGTASSVNFLTDIIDNDVDLFDKRRYFNPNSFYRNYKSLVTAILKANTKTADTAMKSMVKNYHPASWYQIKYDPTMISATVRNSEGKAITPFVPFTPSLRIVANIKRIGTKATIEKYFPEFVDWFMDNPWLRDAMSETTFNGRDKSVEAKRINTMKNFMQVMSVSVAGGVRFRYYGKRLQSTFRRLGDKSYMMSMLGMYMEKDYHIDDYGNVFYTFNRPITQFESTGTQFNVTAFYQNYVLNIDNKNYPSYKGADRRKLDAFLGVIGQEYNRIGREYASRLDYKQRFENYNAKTDKDGVVNTTDETLRAYNFQILKDFFQHSDLTKKIENQLRDAAKQNSVTFDAILASPLDGENRSLREALEEELLSYGKRAFESFKGYLRSIDLIGNTGDTVEDYKTIPNYINLFTEPQIERGEEMVGADFLVSTPLRLEDPAMKEQVLEDFMYNFWFNSMYFNQLFDGDIAVGIKDLITYFKRQKSGVAAGPNRRNHTIDALNDVTRYAVIRSQTNSRQISAYISSTDPYAPTTTSEMEGDQEVAISDGLAWVTIDHRLKEFKAHGLVSPELEALIKKMRYGKLTNRDREKLIEGGIVLNSKKPVIAHPLDYLKNSEHLLIRSDISRIKRSEDSRISNDRYMLELLYTALDAIDFSETGGDLSPQMLYQSILERIHSFYEPIPGRELLHNFLNAMEYHRIDVLADETNTKRAAPSPLVIDITGLENNEMNPDLAMTVNNQKIPVYENGYINLAYSTREVSNEFVYQQVRTSGISEVGTDSIQKKILLTGGIDPTNPKYAAIRKDIKAIRELNEEIAKSRMQYLQRMWGAEDPSVFITKLISQGLISQGASSNLLKYYKINPKTGKKEFNLNLPILGKTPLYYFFSLFNRNVFSPKVPGKKFIHVSSLGYKIKDEATGQYRYPAVRKQTVTVDGQQVEQTIVEVLIPRELAANAEEQRFFEDLYSQFLAARIPTEGHRSMVVAKVVGYLDASYGNSIVVPTQVHKWAGSDMDIDTLFTEMAGYYRNVRGKLVKYGNYNTYIDAGIPEDDAKFIEYLHFIAQDPAFEEQIAAEKLRIETDPEYKKRSLSDGAARFSPEIRKFFAQSEENAKVKNKKTGKGLGSLSELMTGVKGDLSASEKRTVKLIDRLIPVINVINQNSEKSTDSRVPATPAELKAFTKKFGNPVTPVIQNKLIVHNMNVLANQQVFDEFVREFSADEQIRPYKDDAKLLENFAGVSGLKTANPFLAQTVAMIRSLNQYAKRMIGGNANTNKAVALMLTSNIKLTGNYAFNVSHNNAKAKKLDTMDPKSGVLVGGSIGMATDDGQNQVAGILKLDINTSSIMNAMYAYGFPPQLARMIHSVGFIGDVINKFRLNNDKSFVEPGQRQYGFTTYLNNEINKYIMQYEEELSERKLLKATDVADVYEIDPKAFTIKFSDITAPIEGSNPSDFNITVVDKKGKELPQELAKVVLLGFYHRMNTVGNRMSFKIATITNVLKSIAPSFNNVSRIEEAAKFINDNDVFKEAEKLWKDYPVIDTLVNEVLPQMIDTSKLVLLDKTNLFSAVISMFKNNNDISQDEVVTELKSVLAMSALNASVQERMKEIQGKEEQTGDDYIIKMFHNAFQTDYWTKDSSVNDLGILLENAPNNLFLQTVSSALIPGSNVRILESSMGNRLSLADQEQIIDSFLELANSNNPQVQDAAVQLAIAAIVKDGAVSRRGGFLKIIAPSLFKPVSDRLDLIQTGFREADAVGKKKIETYLKRIDKVFSDMYLSKTTGSEAMTGILNKMISIFTLDAEPNVRLRMGFYLPKPGSNLTPGKFARIPLERLKTIIDTVLPNNKNFIYKPGKQGRLIDANHDGGSVAGVKAKAWNFEFWKADNNGELFWDMTNIPADALDNAQELLKQQGIYFTKSKEYGFPLYQVNNYAGGQLFVITEIDGKPFTENLFKNLYEAYSEDGEFQYLLRGKTAKYKVISRQGVPGIYPNSFSNQTGIELRNSILGRSVSRARSEMMLPSSARVIDEAHTVAVNTQEEAAAISGRTYVQNGVRMMLTSTVDRYSTNPSPTLRGVIFKNGKKITDLVGLNEFANRMGYANYDGFATDPNNQAFLYPKQKTEVYLIPFSAERVDRATDPVTAAQPAVTPKGVQLRNFYTVEKMKKGTFRDIPVRIVDFIPTTKDKEVAARTINGVIEVVPDALRRKFDQKAWTVSATQSDGSKATPLPASMFTSFDQFLTFVLLHEAKHFTIKKAAGETTGQYEDRINAAALEDLNTTYVQPPSKFDESQDNNPFCR